MKGGSNEGNGKKRNEMEGGREEEGKGLHCSPHLGCQLHTSWPVSHPVHLSTDPMTNPGHMFKVIKLCWILGNGYIH